jgi:antitoxin YokJ
MNEDLIEEVRATESCEVFPPEGVPAVGHTHQLPADVEDFYRFCGGARFFKDSPYSLEIVSPSDFVLANPVILGELYEDDISSNWYIVGRSGPEQSITIDLNPDRLGLCYDSFHEVHGVAGSCSIIATSFTDLVRRILDNRGGYWYWLSESFVPIGDAYG